MTNGDLVTDPFGKKIYLLPEICATGNELNEGENIYDEVAAVINRPALLIEVKENNESEFYYFRSVGWEHTLLINVHFRNQRWEAFECKKNPDSRELSVLLKKGKQLL